MTRPFKNALCLCAPPEPIPGYGDTPWALRCHRRTNHPGDHRIVFLDGGIREWNKNDRESRLTKKGYK